MTSDDTHTSAESGRSLRESSRPIVGRRNFLQASGASLAGGSIALSGCVGGDDSVDQLTFAMEPVLDTEIVEDLIEQYEEDTGVSVTIETFPYGGLQETTATQLRASESDFDLMQIDTAWFGAYAGGDLLAPLDDRIDDTDLVDRDVYIDTIMNAVGELEGTTYTLPYYNYAFGQLYRGDLVEDPDLQAEYEDETGRELGFPEDIEEYVELTKFMTRDTTGDGETDLYGRTMQGAAGIHILDEWLPYHYGLGGEYTDGDEVVFGDHIDTALEALEFYEDQITNAAPEAALGWTFNESSEFMADGNAFSLTTYNWLFQRIGDSPIADDLEITNVPGGRSVVGAWGMGIPANLDDARADAAWDFLSWMESEDIRKERASLGAAPTTTDVLADDDLREQFSAHYPVLEEILENGVPLPNSPGAGEINNILGTALNEIVATGADPRETLEAAAEDMESVDTSY